jgi:hypothetical protein
MVSAAEYLVLARRERDPPDIPVARQQCDRPHRMTVDSGPIQEVSR